MEMVSCPVCNGSGHLSHQPVGGCLCCNGQGKISREKDERLAMIRADLKERLKERGIDVS